MLNATENYRLVGRLKLENCFGKWYRNTRCWISIVFDLLPSGFSGFDLSLFGIPWENP
jgi:hypothetical protein